MHTAISLVVAGLLMAAANAYAAEERPLFDNPGYDVFVPGDFPCNQPVRVTVYSGSPGLFEADSPELQRIVDGAQAVLAFECPTVVGVELEGWLAGLDEPVYFGVAGPHSNWELATRQSIQSEEYEAYQPPMGDDGYGLTDDAQGFTVANLSAGMSVDQARTAVVDTFGVEPEYDVKDGILSMYTGGCPAGYDWAALSPTPEPGWRCLQAWFTDQRLARLYLLDLVQVIDAEDPESVERYLIDRFGEPAYRGTEQRDRGWWQGEQAIYTLGWGEVVESQEAGGDGEQTDIYNVQAKVLTIGDATVVTVTLYEPGLRPRVASDADDIPDSDDVPDSDDIPDLTL